MQKNVGIGIKMRYKLTNLEKKEIMTLGYF